LTILSRIAHFDELKEKMYRLRRKCWSFTLRHLLLVVVGLGISMVPISSAFLRLRIARKLQNSGVSLQWENGDQVSGWDIRRSLMRSSIYMDTGEEDIPIELLPRIRPMSAAHFYGVDSALDDSDLNVVRQLSELRALTIDSSHVSTDGIRSISHLPHLEYLRLRSDEANLFTLGPVLSEMKSLRLLAVNSCAFTDADLAHVSTLESLEALDISGTSISDAGITHLRSLPQLKRLHCMFTALTDDCISDIAGLEDLEEVQIDMTDISEDGEQSLRRLRPSLKVNPR
jgi:hypothetical protein